MITLYFSKLNTRLNIKCNSGLKGKITYSLLEMEHYTSNTFNLSKCDVTTCSFDTGSCFTAFGFPLRPCRQ